MQPYSRVCAAHAGAYGKRRRFHGSRASRATGIGRGRKGPGNRGPDGRFTTNVQPGEERPPASGSTRLAFAPHTGLRYDEMEKLITCSRCGSPKFWFYGQFWRWWGCVPPPVENVMQVEI